LSKNESDASHEDTRWSRCKMSFIHIQELNMSDWKNATLIQRKA